VLFRPNPLAPFHAREWGKSPPRFGERLICHKWGPERWRTLSPRGWEKWGVQGGFAPWRGVVGAVPPQNLKKGRVANPCNPATSGAQNAGKPSANEGGQTEMEGAEPPPTIPLGTNFKKGLTLGSIGQANWPHLLASF